MDGGRAENRNPTTIPVSRVCSYGMEVVLFKLESIMDFFGVFRVTELMAQMAGDKVGTVPLQLRYSEAD